MKKVGIYGGTFDPIHHAHLILAREALDQLALDEVLFVPAALSPHKQDQPPTPATVRLEMVRAAIAGEPQFRIDERELRRSPPSFTIDTIEEMRTAENELELFYLLGSDNLARLHTWHRFDDLQRLVRFVVLVRGCDLIETRYVTVQRPIDISGTEIRNRVATGRSIRYLVPPAVEEIIRRYSLYQETTRSLQKI